MRPGQPSFLGFLQLDTLGVNPQPLGGPPQRLGLVAGPDVCPGQGRAAFPGAAACRRQAQRL